MKRDGDKILFDSAEQQQQFERAMIRADGAADTIMMLVEAIGRARMDADIWWRKAKDHADPATERLVYNWTTRELLIRKLAKEVGASG